MLRAAHTDFGLSNELIEEATGLNATGSKTYYLFTITQDNDIFGYDPIGSSLIIVLQPENRQLKIIRCKINKLFSVNSIWLNADCERGYKQEATFLINYCK